MTDQSDNEHDPVVDYKVGYCQPPKHSQFQPGKSGNPEGRKRKPKSVQAQMEKILATKVAINEAGQTKKLPLQQVILRNLANKAAKGDLKSATFVFNLLHAPEFADSDVIDQDKLSAEDQAMLKLAMAQLASPDSEDKAIRPAPSGEEDVLAAPPPPPPPTTTIPETTKPIEEDDHNDE